jgi:hypothetical protein
MPIQEQVLYHRHDEWTRVGSVCFGTWFFFYFPCSLVWIFIPGFSVNICLSSTCGRYSYIAISCVILFHCTNRFSSWPCGFYSMRLSYFFTIYSCQLLRQFNTMGPHTFCCFSQPVHILQHVISVPKVRCHISLKRLSFTCVCCFF